MIEIGLGWPVSHKYSLVISFFIYSQFRISNDSGQLLQKGSFAQLFIIIDTNRLAVTFMAVYDWLLDQLEINQIFTIE